MDVDGVRDRSIGRLRIHHVKQAVDGFVTTDAEDGGAEQAFAGAVYNHFHEAKRLATLNGAPYAQHRPHADTHVVARAQSLCFGESDPRQRRINEERIAGNAVRNATRPPMQKPIVPIFGLASLSVLR